MGWPLAGFKLASLNPRPYHFLFTGPFQPVSMGVNGWLCCILRRKAFRWVRPIYAGLDGHRGHGNRDPRHRLFHGRTFWRMVLPFRWFHRIVGLKMVPRLKRRVLEKAMAGIGVSG